MRIRVFLIVVLISFFITLHAQSPKHEFRGVWIASVVNIDWPSKFSLSSSDQQKEFIKILDMHKNNGMNAVVVQIRPAADAFYPSRLEPWSKWLSGTLGKAPQPYYDPLQYMIEESHKRGMEFHAWFNPYRAVMNVDTAKLDPASVAFKNREWFVKYDKHLYFNPGIPEARKHVINVVMDVVNRYDVDGIHFDDYFYPYKVTGLNFPDSTEFNLHGKQFATIDDWRRNNVDVLIENISDSLRKVKSHVRFGVSPFGVWRNKDKDPNGSATRAGQTCYDDLYADVLKWMHEGWIDYVAPQIYWTIGFKPASYDIIAKWWSDNSHGIPIYIGHATYRINNHASDSVWKQSDQMGRQIRLNRTLPNIHGSIFFSSKSFIPNPLGICDTLRNSFYRFNSVQQLSNQETRPSNYPLTFSVVHDGIVVQWKEPASNLSLSSHARYIIYRFEQQEQIELDNAKKIVAIVTDTNPYSYATQKYKDTTAKPRKKYYYVVTSLNRSLTETKPKFAYSIKRYKRYWKEFEAQKL